MSPDRPQDLLGLFRSTPARELTHLLADLMKGAMFSRTPGAFHERGCMRPLRQDSVSRTAARARVRNRNGHAHLKRLSLPEPCSCGRGSMVTYCPVFGSKIVMAASRRIARIFGKLTKEGKMVNEPLTRLHHGLL